MKKLNFLIISLGLALGLGFNLYIARIFWIMLFTNTYIFGMHANLFGEFYFEFIFFNLSVVIIVIALIFSFKSYGEQYRK